MLVPVLLKANYKVATALVLTLEDLVASNLPLLFPELVIYNRNAAAGTTVAALARKTTYLNSVDMDFDGVVTTALSSASLGMGVGLSLSLATNSLLPSSYSISHELTITNAGPVVEARVSLVLKGLIETSVMPDPLIVQNV